MIVASQRSLKVDSIQEHRTISGTVKMPNKGYDTDLNDAAWTTVAAALTSRHSLLTAAEQPIFAPY